MTEDNGPYWVDVTLDGEEMQEKIEKAMDEAAFVRMWAVERLTARWQAATGFPTTAQLTPALTKFIHEKGLRLQRYTALFVLNSTVTIFNRQVVAERTGIAGQLALVTFPKGLDGRIELVLQARALWRKYVYLYSQISTVYGSIELNEGWTATLRKQAREMEVGDQLFPYLWYAAGLTHIDGQYKLRFYAHPPQSTMGKRLDKKRKEREKWV